jgi:TatD DNase family protein
MVILFDVHAHLEHPLLASDLPDVIARAKAAGIKVIIANGVDRETNRAVLELAKRFDIVKPALGIYPVDALAVETQASEWANKKFDVDEEIDFIRKTKCVALGEVGLDLKDGTDIGMQKRILAELVEIAKKKNVPVIVHTRKAEIEAIDLLEASGHKKVILHCFSGRKHLIKRAADLGFSFSVPCSVVKTEHFQQLVRDVHISQLLTETDAPYQSPFVGKRNEPAFIVESVKKMAELKGMTFEDTANNLYMNYQKMF